MLLFLPSPAHNAVYIGPIPIRGYAMSILVGIVVAVLIGRARWKKWGEDVSQLENVALVATVIGIVGARIYWVIIEWPRYFGPGGTWYHIFYVWQGGLGIWGAIVFGFLTGWLMCRHYKINFLRFADCVAPAFLLAQGIGRLGNWWNQELYGLPTTLPWALEIDPAHRVAGYEQYATFHPTFLYEMLWNFAGVGVLLWAEKRFKLGRGKLFALYITIYAFGRFLIEFLRIDPVDVIWGMRVNSWVTLAGGLFGIGLFWWLLKHRPGPNEPVVPSQSSDRGPGEGADHAVRKDADNSPTGSAGHDAEDDPGRVAANNRNEADSIEEPQP